MTSTARAIVSRIKILSIVLAVLLFGNVWKRAYTDSVNRNFAPCPLADCAQIDPP